MGIISQDAVQSIDDLLYNSLSLMRKHKIKQNHLPTICNMLLQQELILNTNKLNTSLVNLQNMTNTANTKGDGQKIELKNG